MKARRSANSTSPSPCVHEAPGAVCWKPIGITISYWLRCLIRCSYTSSLLTAFAPWPVNSVVQTVSFSGNAFSVKKARGKFRSPRGHCGSVQSVHM